MCKQRTCATLLQRREAAESADSRHDLDASGFAESRQLALLERRVHLDLVHVGHFLAGAEQLLQVPYLKYKSNGAAVFLTL